jgi:glycosyltransferase involved in cell wall biosynthesis
MHSGDANRLRPNKVAGSTFEGRQPCHVIMAATVDISEPNACAIHLAAVGGGLSKRGYQVSLMVPRPPGGRAPSVDFPAIGVAFEETPGGRWGLPNTVGFLLMLPQLLRRAGAIRAAGSRPCFYIRYSPISFVAIAALKLFVPGATIVSEHNGWIVDEAIAGGWPVWLSRLAGWTQKLDSRLADAVRVVSPEIGESLRKSGIADSKMFVAENAGDIVRLHPMDRNEAIAKIGLDRSKIYVGFLGNLTIWQGVSLGLDAFARLKDKYPNLDFIVGGDGPELNNLKAQATRLGMAERVHFLGSVRLEVSNDVMNCLDIALCPFPANRPMGSPVKLRDYAAAGRAIVASRYSAITKLANPDWVVLHDCDDAADLAAKVESLVDDAPRRALLSAAARRFAEEHFGWNAAISAIASHFPAP